MSWNKFLAGYALVVLLTFSKSRLIDYWVPIEFSIYLVFFVIRSSETVRALTLTFLCSISLDFIFQAYQVKGLACMGQLLLVYAVCFLKRHVIPQFEDLFLLAFFAIFYLGNYYITLGLGSLLGLHVQRVLPVNSLFHALFHTAIFGLLLLAVNKFRRDTP